MRARDLILLTATLAVAACDGTRLPFAPRDGDVVLSGNTVTGTGTLEELRVRREAWLATGPRSYRVEEQLSCFCFPSVDFEAAVVEVRDRQLHRVWNLRTAREFTPSPFGVRSIEALFDHAIAEAERGELVRVRYDATFGFPAVLTIGTPENDGGYSFIVGALRPL